MLGVVDRILDVKEIPGTCQVLLLSGYHSVRRYMERLGFTQISKRLLQVFPDRAVYHQYSPLSTGGSGNYFFLSACLAVCLYACLSVCLCPSCRSICLSAYLSVSLVQSLKNNNDNIRYITTSYSFTSRSFPTDIRKVCVSACTQKTPNLRCWFFKRRLTNTSRRHRLVDG